MNPVMYIFVNAGAKMSQGKLGAQVGHAVLDAYYESSQDMIDAWYVGHHTAKVVLHADDAQHLLSIERYINDRGFETALVIDEGRTEVGPFTPTALGVEIVDKDDPHTKATFGDFQLLKDPKTKGDCPGCGGGHKADCPAVPDNTERVSYSNYFTETAKPKFSFEDVRTETPGKPSLADFGRMVPLAKDLLNEVDLDTLLKIRQQFMK